ncbi:uncharacterized protein LOC120431854 [Culex pipiens pallens]|uniref:uncharacterized protein LOC120431854 n=1 Tax=Culex pipiens pallens TaxID=42434 RepID=UPI001952EFFC|nr:uncharacterized protein LOC120431854 [Culex pipiens pallens]
MDCDYVAVKFPPLVRGIIPLNLNTGRQEQDSMFPTDIESLVGTSPSNVSLPCAGDCSDSVLLFELAGSPTDQVYCCGLADVAIVRGELTVAGWGDIGVSHVMGQLEGDLKSQLM